MTVGVLIGLEYSSRGSTTSGRGATTKSATSSSSMCRKHTQHRHVVFMALAHVSRAASIAARRSFPPRHDDQLFPAL